MELFYIGKSQGVKMNKMHGLYTLISENVFKFFGLLMFMGLLMPQMNAKSVDLLAGKKTVMLGDSITQNGTYINFLTYHLNKVHPDKDFDIYGLGLSSETLSGLSEERHAGGRFPRPVLFERLDRLFKRIQPQVVISCYGINDGIYQPLDEERFNAFKKGVQKLIDKCKAEKVDHIFLVTPPIYDFTPKKKDDFNYDSVMTAYAKWLNTIDQPNVYVIDLHTKMRQHRDTHKKVLSRDKVHPGDEGHLLMATSILNHFNVEPTEQSTFEIKADKMYGYVADKNKLRSSNWMKHIGYTREREYKPRALGGVEIEAAKIQRKMDIQRGRLTSSIFPLKADLPETFADNAVFQQGMPYPIFGSVRAGAEIIVSFNGQTKTTKADDKGNWKVLLDPLTATKLKSVNEVPKGHKLTIVSKIDGKEETVEFKNIVIGEVWLCAGQSNMAGRIKTNKTRHYPENTLELAKYPGLRQLKGGQWEICSPETAPNFSKVTFFFSRRVYQGVLIPVGVITRAVGGSNIESWLNQKPYETGGNYVKLITPLIGYGLGGAIWYQGESNEKDKREYHPKLKSLITGWRKVWGQGDFPVHYVQLPGLRNSTKDNPAGGDGRAEIRRAYVETLAVKNTGLAVTIDIGTPGEHPPNKYDTGDRLARSVLNKVYEMKEVTACPLYKEHIVEGDKVRIKFTDVPKGLMVAKKEWFPLPTPTPDKKIDWLSIQDKSGEWFWADAKIDGSDLIVFSEKVKEPIAVRYAYTAQPLGHLLYNKDGMPVGPFSTCGYDAKVKK